MQKSLAFIIAWIFRVQLIRDFHQIIGLFFDKILIELGILYYFQCIDRYAQLVNKSAAPVAHEEMHFYFHFHQWR